MSGSSVNEQPPVQSLSLVREPVSRPPIPSSHFLSAGSSAETVTSGQIIERRHYLLQHKPLAIAIFSFVILISIVIRQNRMKTPSGTVWIPRANTGNAPTRHFQPLKGYVPDCDGLVIFREQLQKRSLTN
ncbi:hypothetical protein Ocin01_05069 [Orchesella cincta]|uniref:Uncharacterized protein n=1 Tax=Orchesella cincta TaxID=48709 RepID=A0A1D2N8J1_ORCCI|nr:hypothetical protein Ocin01_05069 [Orchesella cincta]